MMKISRSRTPRARRRVAGGLGARLEAKIDGVWHACNAAKGSPAHYGAATHALLNEIYEAIHSELARGISKASLRASLRRLGPIRDRRRRSVFLWAINAVYSDGDDLRSELAPKERSKWAKALEFAYRKNVAPKCLLSFIADRGGISGVARAAERASARRAVRADAAKS